MLYGCEIWTVKEKEILTAIDHVVVKEIDEIRRSDTVSQEIGKGKNIITSIIRKGK